MAVTQLTETAVRLGDAKTETPLRLSIVTETYPPEVNGVAMTVACLVRGLLARRHSVQVVRPRQASEVAGAVHGLFSEVLTSGVPIPGYPELRLGLPAGRLLQRVWERDRPDVVHLATPGPLAWSALRVAERMGIPVISEFRTNFHAYSQHYRLGFLRNTVLGYLRSFHNRGGCTLVPTPRLAQELAGFGFERLSVVARGVDSERFSPGKRSRSLRDEWGANEETLVVIGVGRLATEKNLRLLVETFRAIRSVREDSRLVLVGDGPERRVLEVLCPDAVFAGRRYEDDLARHYASADLLVFPSLTETFGNVTVEGMASGLPVIAFDYGAAHEWIQPACNGWTVPVGDSAGFLRQAVDVAKNRGALSRVGMAARETALTKGWGRILGQLEQIYRASRRESAGESMGEGRGRGRSRSEVFGNFGRERATGVGVETAWFPGRARLDAPCHGIVPLDLGRRRPWQRATLSSAGRWGAFRREKGVDRSEVYGVSTHD